MTQDETIEMARQAGLETQDGFSESVFYFAKLVAEHEREACAEVCERISRNPLVNPVASVCAIALRARGKK